MEKEEKDKVKVTWPSKREGGAAVTTLFRSSFTIKGRWTFAIFTQHQRDQEREGSKEEERREIK